jgi:hypothetical protein
MSFPATRLSLREPATADISARHMALAALKGNIRSLANRRV